MKDNNYLNSLSKRPFSRVMAWICLIVIVALIVATFVSGITGSKYFMGFLVLTIIVPIFMYVFLWIGKVLYSMRETKNEEE